MKKKIICISLIALLLCIVISAFAARTVGPNVTVTLATANKFAMFDEPYVTIKSIYIESGLPYLFYIRHNESGKRVTPKYKFEQDGGMIKNNMYYLTESRVAGYINTGDSYSGRATSNHDTLPDEIGEISLNTFAP